MELRGKLDRFGLRQRVLVPTKTGFDVLIPDPGGRSLARVRQYAKRQGVDLQASRGHFKAVGDGDQSRARELFRNTAVRA